MKFIVKPDGTPMPENFRANNTEYELWESGKTRIQKLAGYGDCFIMDWNGDNGMMLYCVLNNPSPDETAAITSPGEHFEIAFTELEDCGFFSVKFGSLPWGDCTFDPRVYDREIDFPDYASITGIGMALNIVLVDPGEGGLVKGIRLLGLGNQFSRKFVEWCGSKETHRTSFSKPEHDTAVRKVQASYTSRMLQEHALFRWKTGEGEEKERKSIGKEEYNR